MHAFEIVRQCGRIQVAGKSRFAIALALVVACGSLWAATAAPLAGQPAVPPLRVLHAFGADGDGRLPWSGVTADADGNLYGSTVSGDAFGRGTLYRVSPDGHESVLHAFGDGDDGASPKGLLAIDPSGTLYGTTAAGGFYRQGTVFRVTRDGVETVLHHFGSAVDGKIPQAGLVSDGRGGFYGTTSLGGSRGAGTVFKIGADGGAIILHAFGAAGDGARPWAAPVLDLAGNLVGTTSAGGVDDQGVIYRITADGQASVLHAFAAAQGQHPYAPLVLDRDGHLFGTTYDGGPYGDGTVFSLAPDGTFRLLHAFAHPARGVQSNGSRATITAGLVLDTDGNLYGVGYGDGQFGHGSIYRIRPDGALDTLINFGLAPNAMFPVAELRLAPPASLVGTTSRGGAFGAGTVFRLDLRPQS